jgi:hypothetical protein
VVALRRAFLYAAGQDPAGISFRLAKAINRHSDRWVADAMNVTGTYLRYPEQHMFSAQTARQLYENADLIHLHQYVKPLAKWKYRRGDKGLVLHHHGTHYRDDSSAIHAEARRLGATEVVSTIGLRLLQGAQWLPSPYEGETLRRLREELWEPSATLRIAHAPTDRAIKSTDALIAAVERLRHAGFPVELRLIEKMTWRECLNAKAQCDVLVDQVHLEYGCNAVEAWGMRMPVIAGSDSPRVLELMERTFGQLPFLSSSEAVLESAIAAMLDPVTRRFFSEVGEAHFARWHEAKVVARMATDMYDDLVAARAA